MKTVIFDLDGTLADTSGDLLAAANTCFRSLGLGDLLGPDDAGTAVRGARAMLKLGFSRVDGYGEDAIDAQYQPLLDAYAADIDTHTFIFPGAMDAIAELKSRGYGIGIATNKPEGLAQSLLTRLGVRADFASMIGSDTLEVKKPDPEHLFEAARRAGGDPAKTCIIGDTQTDSDTAKNGGVPCVLVTFGPGTDDRAALTPDALLHDYADLPDLIDRLLAD